jgi:hypothetical protein
MEATRGYHLLEVSVVNGHTLPFLVDKEILI